MWPKEMFEWKQNPFVAREELLKQLIAEKSTAYLKDFVLERETTKDM